MKEKQPGQDHVESLLTGMGFKVTRISGTPHSLHADTLAEKDKKRTFLEIKSRLDDPIYEKLLPEAIQNGGASYTVGEGKQNTFSRKIKKAAAQLQASAGENDFRCLWYVIREEQLAEVAEQIQSTLLGRRFLLGGKEDDSSGPAQSEPCYVLSRADLFRFPAIDAVVIDFLNKGVLIVNPASSRYKRIHECPLWQIFNEHGAVKDIYQEEQVKKAYIVPKDMKITSDQDILNFLRGTYNLTGMLTFFDLTTYGAITMLPPRRPSQA